MMSLEVGVGLLKDNPIWGDNYHGWNILSGPRAQLRPSPPRKSQTRWFVQLPPRLAGFRRHRQRQGIYPRGISNRIVYRQSSFNANLFPFTPQNRRFNFSFRKLSRLRRPARPSVILIPFLFYKSVDRWLKASTGSNFLGRTPSSSSTSVPGTSATCTCSSLFIGS